MSNLIRIDFAKNSHAASPAELAAAKAELSNCEDAGGECAWPNRMHPLHFASASCESNGRRWDSDKQQMVGIAHCSCDACF